MASNREKSLAALRRNRDEVKITEDEQTPKETHRLTLDLERDLYKRLAIRRVEGKGTVKAQIEAAIRQYLGAHEGEA